MLKLNSNGYFQYKKKMFRTRQTSKKAKQYK